jgi:hypothetical protein
MFCDVRFSALTSNVTPKLERALPIAAPDAVEAPEAAGGEPPAEPVAGADVGPVVAAEVELLALAAGALPVLTVTVLVPPPHAETPRAARATATPHLQRHPANRPPALASMRSARSHGRLPRLSMITIAEQFSHATGKTRRSNNGAQPEGACVA